MHAIEGIGNISTEAICVPLGDEHQPLRCTVALGFALPAFRLVPSRIAVSDRAWTVAVACLLRWALVA